MNMRRLGVARLSILGLLALGACGGRNKDGTGSPPGTEVGTVDVALQLAPGLTFNTASYSLTGPAAFTRMGSVDISHSAAVSFTVGGLPAGSGYALTVSGTLSDGTTTCSGSSVAFAIMARATTTVSIHLQCREQARTGSARINGTINICPVIDAMAVSPAEIEVGNAVALTAAAHDTDGVPSPLTYSWTATAGTITAPTAANTSFVCTAPGTVTVTLAVSDGDCGESATETVVCSPTPVVLPAVKITEIESNQGTPDDWVELYNAGAAPTDLSGWIFKDNDDTHTFTIPVGTTIAPGAYLVLEAFGFGLGAADSARLYTSSGVTVVDSYAWTAHATTTYGRCPNPSGDFTTTADATKGAANSCGGGAGGAAGTGGGGTGGNGGGGAGGGGTGGAPIGGAPVGGSTALAPWPGGNMVATLDAANAFPSNLSGLSYQPATGTEAPVLWALLNSPSLLLQLQADAGGTTWASPAGAWATGKTLTYPAGTGSPDSESLTRVEAGSPMVYVAAERDNLASGTSRLSILRYDTSAAGATLTATHEWNLTGDLPAVGANLGLEAIVWLPDATLVAAGFVDDSTGAAYAPAVYPDHGGGLFAVGVESTGMIHVYALNHANGTFHRLGSFSSGQVGTMGMEFDRDSGYLWAQCDNTCGNHAAVLEIETNAASPNRGHFAVRRIFDRASTLPDSNNEGIAIAPESECVSGLKSFFWSDDSNFAMHALRKDTIPCGHFIP